MSALEDRKRARAGFEGLRIWLVEAAGPFWGTVGVNSDGLFEELVAPDGRPIAAPRRARVQPRQLYALSVAMRMGAPIEPQVLSRGLETFLQRYLRPDGLVRTLIDSDGGVLDDRAVLYDQAFALYALAHLRPLLGEGIEAKAVALREAVFTAFRHGDSGFWSVEPGPGERLSNPHMHLLEACLAWIEAGGDEVWGCTAEAIVRLALDRFIDPVCGGLREFFDGDWAPQRGEAGKIVEPGHQFEWAWLLLRWTRIAPHHPLMVPARVAAMRLLHIGEKQGVDPQRNVAMNALLDDFSIHDGDARLWPQTERIKAWALACAQLGGHWWGMVADAIEGLGPYLAVSMPGLWFDRMTRDGELIEASTPASSFYHIVCAIEALEHALGAAPDAGEDRNLGGSL